MSDPPPPFFSLSLLWKDSCFRSSIHNCKKLLSGISTIILPYIHIVLFPVRSKYGKMGHFDIWKSILSFLKNHGRVVRSDGHHSASWMTPNLISYMLFSFQSLGAEKDSLDIVQHDWALPKFEQRAEAVLRKILSWRMEFVNSQLDRVIHSTVLCYMFLFSSVELHLEYQGGPCPQNF